MCEQVKNLLFLPLHGRIIGNAFGVGVPRALKADLIQYQLSGDFIIDRNETTVVSALCSTRQSAPCESHRYSSGKMAFGYQVNDFPVHVL